MIVVALSIKYTGQDVLFLGGGCPANALRLPFSSGEQDCIGNKGKGAGMNVLYERILSELGNPITMRFYEEFGLSGYSVYEMSAIATGRSNVYRRDNIKDVIHGISALGDERSVYILPYESVYPAYTCDYVVGKIVRQSRWTVIDIDKRGEYREEERDVFDDHIQVRVKPRYVVATGRGFQLWYRFTECVNEETLATCTRHLSASISTSHSYCLDKKGGDFRRHFRAPGYINHKYPARPVASIIQFNDCNLDPREVIGSSNSSCTDIPDILTKDELSEFRKSKRDYLEAQTQKQAHRITRPYEVQGNEEACVRQPNEVESKNPKRERFLAGVKGTRIGFKKKLKQQLSTLPHSTRKVAKAAFSAIRYSHKERSPLGCRVLVEICEAKGIKISKDRAAEVLKLLVKLELLAVNRSVDAKKAYEYWIVDEGLVFVYGVKKREYMTEEVILAACRLDEPGMTNYNLIKFARMTRFSGADPGRIVTLWINENSKFMSSASIGSNLPRRFMTLYAGVFSKGNQEDGGAELSPNRA